MLDLLHDVFGWVCGQGLAHTWSPGGELLPVCQRCTGVYVGAFVAAVLHLARRPAPTTPWLWLNGAFLLFIMPSGFYWIPQNPELRCASGILFGFGLVSFLSLTWPRKIGAGGRAEQNSRAEVLAIATTLLVTLVLTPLLAEVGGTIGAGILIFACVGGALTLAALVLANLFFSLRWLARLSRNDATA